MTRSVETYFEVGCGRCDLGGTPDCKVHTWAHILNYLRKLCNDCGLTEECKWGSPCYTFNGQNVVMLGALKDYTCLSFFKGVLLQDATGLLQKPGEMSQAVKMFKFTDYEQVKPLATVIKQYIFEAIEIEKAGLKVAFSKQQEPIPDELALAFEKNPDLKSAFFALSAGRQRGYIIHFSQPKQAATRFSRIEKQTDKILSGKGFFD